MLLGAVLALPMVSSARCRADTLPQLFPALASLRDATSVVVVVGWGGLSPTSPITAEYMLEVHGDQFEGNGRFKVSWATSMRKIAVPREGVQAFLDAAGGVELVEKAYTPRITHTDDFPYVGIRVHAGQELVEIATRSQLRRPEAGQYLDQTPWAITYLGRTFVVTASDLDKALAPLLLELQYEKVVSELAAQLKPRWAPQ
jgi:hypothetical protein